MTMCSWQIRSARPDDCEDILRMIKDLPVFHKDPPSVVKFTEEDLKQHLQGGIFECLVAEENENSQDNLSTEPMSSDGVKKLVGFVLVHGGFSLYTGIKLYMEGLYVDLQSRGRGIGKAFMKRVAQIAKEKGCTKISWELMEWNKLALDFYESMGAKPSKWKYYYLDNEPILELAGPDDNSAS